MHQLRKLDKPLQELLLAWIQGMLEAIRQVLLNQLLAVHLIYLDQSHLKFLTVYQANHALHL